MTIEEDLEIDKRKIIFLLFLGISLVVYLLILSKGVESPNFFAAIGAFISLVATNYYLWDRIRVKEEYFRYSFNSYLRSIPKQDIEAFKLGHFYCLEGVKNPSYKLIAQEGLAKLLSLPTPKVETERKDLDAKMSTVKVDGYSIKFKVDEVRGISSLYGVKRPEDDFHEYLMPELEYLNRRQKKSLIRKIGG